MCKIVNAALGATARPGKNILSQIQAINRLSPASSVRRDFLVQMTTGAAALAMMGGSLFAGETSPATVERPSGKSSRSLPLNIVVVLADDMGYGDVACYDPENAKVKTPCIDRMARQGMMFMDAHTSSPVCSPTRYSLLTGRYHWRRGMSGALRMYDPPVIAPGRVTVPRLLREQGYRTACIGKWHLGFDWPGKNKTFDFSKPITGGPLAAGFEYFFGVDAPNFPPFTYIENERVTVPPTEQCQIDKKMMVNHQGPMAPGWRFDGILPTLVEKSGAYIAERASRREPFFLYLALTSPHYPIAPSAGFKGKSGISPVADFIMETDWALGRIMEALDQNGVGEDTLLLFITDNGHDPKSDIEPFLKAGHRVSGPFSGAKFSIKEGGHRVPFVARWPRVVAPGSRCGKTISVTDLLATVAAMNSQQLPDNAGEDSTSILPLLHGRTEGYSHPAVVLHSPNGEAAIRRGEWKLTLGRSQAPAADSRSAVQLYDLARDPAEKEDRAAENPELVRELADLMQRYIADGRSTPGIPQKNDVSVNLQSVPAPAR